jgi:hypothetical protein
MARVGISEIRMRRKAFATEVSRPMREKVVSRAEVLWNWTFRFWGKMSMMEYAGFVYEDGVVPL